MEMRARRAIPLGHGLTPPLPPLAFSLYTSSLLSLTLLFSPLPNPSFLPHYCSLQCSIADSPLRLSSAENHLPHAGEDTSDLRTALRLLRYFEELELTISSRCKGCERIGGLMSNRENLVLNVVRMFSKQGEDNEVLARIKEGAMAMAKARRMRDGLDIEIVGGCEVEEALLCVVLTNAVEVQVNRGPGVGIAVYDVAFSWINHSCSPNACYRFSLHQTRSGESQMLIVPASHSGVEATIHREFELNRDGEKHGPRIVVRSIKAIEEGDEVLVAYTDLLQPKVLCNETRQRCIVSPPTYVDRTLQEIFAVNCNSRFITSDYEDETNERFAVFVEDAINDYLMHNNPKSCCDKLERLLVNGTDENLESKEAKLKYQLFLHPLHHLCLNAYTALSSAYKTQAIELFDLDSQEKLSQFEVFDMYRTSSAYALLLAAATHHLFLSETSLVVSVASFWTQAGDSLLNVAKTTVGESFPNSVQTMETLGSLQKYRIYTFGPTPAKEVFEEISRGFLEYVTCIAPKVWPFLIQKSCYLKRIKDPIDFGWTNSIDSMILLHSMANFNGAAMESSGSRGRGFICTDEENINIFQLSVHCLLYGRYLLSTFCGQSPHLNEHVDNLLADCTPKN